MLVKIALTPIVLIFGLGVMSGAVGLTYPVLYDPLTTGEYIPATLRTDGTLTFGDGRSVVPTEEVIKMVDQFQVRGLRRTHTHDGRR